MFAEWFCITKLIFFEILCKSCFSKHRSAQSRASGLPLIDLKCVCRAAAGAWRAHGSGPCRRLSLAAACREPVEEDKRYCESQQGNDGRVPVGCQNNAYRCPNECACIHHRENLMCCSLFHVQRNNQRVQELSTICLINVKMCV